MTDRAELDRRFPSLAAIERAASRRMPLFALDYLRGGIGAELGLARNRADLDRAVFAPRHLTPDRGKVDTTTEIFGQRFAAPFGVAPMGLTGLMWPRALPQMAAAAALHGVPLGVSSSATESLEDLRAVAGKTVWFQLYGCRDPEVERDLMDRARGEGADVLLVTIDILGTTRRERELIHGVSIPPRFGPKTVWQAILRPAWSAAILRHGMPRFRMLDKYIPAGAGLGDVARTLGALREFRYTPHRLAELRKTWPGKLVVKGVLHPDDARACLEAGADGIVVSNHGGRQNDAAPSAAAALPAIRAAVGPDFPLIADGGVRSGLDVIRFLALGADFVLVGRPMLYGAASGAGAEHVMHILKQEIEQTTAQLGCVRPIEARDRLWRDGGPR